jgi:hypothetical protein
MKHKIQGPYETRYGSPKFSQEEWLMSKPLKTPEKQPIKIQGEKLIFYHII